MAARGAGRHRARAALAGAAGTLSKACFPSRKAAKNAPVARLSERGREGARFRLIQIQIRMTG
jgi:hypothetical protein